MLRIYLVLLAGCSCLPSSAAEPLAYKVTAPPAELELTSFYKKHVSARGYPVISSGKVNDYALKEAAYLIDMMLAERDKRWGQR